MSEITRTCGALYLENSQKLKMRDKDRADCDLCGETLNQWDGSVMYSYMLIMKPKPEENSILTEDPNCYNETDV